MTSVTASDVRSESDLKAHLRRHLPLILTLVGFAPLMWWHFAQLLQKPHYQFVIFLPIALYLLYISLPEREEVRPKNVWELSAGAALLMVACAGLTFATLYWSPWIASVAFLVAILGSLLLMGGMQTLSRWFPVWVFCLAIVPLPFGMDEDLVLRLRNVTTQWSSMVLDQIGILHQVYANVIELPGKSLFIADACSGIHSLYVLLAVGLFVSAFYRRSLLHTAALLLSTFGWVLVENVARIVVVAIAWTRGYDLSLGWPHFALGIVLFVISSALIFSTDQFFLFLLPEKLFHKLSGFFRERFAEVSPAAASTSEMPASSGQNRVWLSVACVFPVLGLMQLYRMPSETPDLAMIFTRNIDIPELGEDFLDGSIAGFTRERYKIVKRVKGDPFGQESQQWTFRKGPLVASIYLDYPYTQTHDLCQCYNQIGWEINSPRVMPVEEFSDRESGFVLTNPIATASLRRPFYGDAVIMFSQFDLAGRDIAAVKAEIQGTVDQRAGRRFQSAWSSQEQETSAVKDSPKPPFFQIQVFATGLDREREDEQRAELAQLYEAVHSLLKTKVLELGRESEQGKGPTL